LTFGLRGMPAPTEAVYAPDAVARVGRWRCLVPPPLYPVNPRRAPTFSVIIPAYDASAFVGDAVRSALEQTIPPLEVIVCDDGSEDDIKQSLPSLGHLVLLQQPHRGVAAARNRAVEAASGDFVAILDADDIYLPERLESLGALAGARPDLDILTTDASYEVDGSVFGRFNEDTPFAVEDQRTAILQRCFCPWPAIRRSRLLAIGGFDESLETGSDWECLIRLILVGCAAGLVDEPLYRYRVREASLTSARVSTLRDRIGLLEKTATHPGLRPPERRALARSLAAQRRSLLLAETESSLRARRPDARRLALRAALTRGGIRPGTRLRALMSAFAPGLAGRVLERHARTSGESNLTRPLARRGSAGAQRR
jgi:Glycosyl transferase family 2